MVPIDEERLRRLAAKSGFLFVTLPPSATATKEGAIRYLVDQLATAGKIPADLAAEVVLSLLRREQLGSTAIGRDLALPHAIWPHVTAPIGVFAYSDDDVPWETPDGEAVRMICLALAPDAGSKLRFIETLARRLRE